MMASRTLTTLRETLRPKLLSGQLGVQPTNLHRLPANGDHISLST